MGRVAALAILLSEIAAAQPSQPVEQPRPIVGMTVVFSVDLPLDIPGAVLGPGEYVLRLKKDPGRSGDLAQLQLWDASETNVVAELYAVQRSDQGSPENSIITYYEGPTGRRVLKAW